MVNLVVCSDRCRNRALVGRSPRGARSSGLAYGVGMQIGQQARSARTRPRPSRRGGVPAESRRESCRPHTSACAAGRGAPSTTAGRWHRAEPSVINPTARASAARPAHVASLTYVATMDDARPWRSTQVDRSSGGAPGPGSWTGPFGPRFVELLRVMTTEQQTLGPPSTRRFPASPSCPLCPATAPRPVGVGTGSYPLSAGLQPSRSRASSRT